jgi:RNA polymerase sigma factor (TIGR02999 family)
MFGFGSSREERVCSALHIVDSIGPLLNDETQIPSVLNPGGRGQSEQLVPRVYDELRRLAAAKLANEPIGHTLDATALVHEAYLKLGGEQSFATKTAFLQAAAVAMRRVLVDHARAKRADKRGGDWQRIAPPEVGSTTDDSDLIALDEALAELGVVDPEATKLVELRYFAGLTIPQAAEALGISPRTADRIWAYARAWLFRKISGKKLA